MAADKKKKEDKKKSGGTPAATGASKSSSTATAIAPGAVVVLLRGFAFLVVFIAGHTLATAGEVSDDKTPISIWGRMIFFFLAQGTAMEFFQLLMMQVARFALREGRPFGAEYTPEERATNDPTIPWPNKDFLPEDLQQFISKKGQPFYLNHVPGRRRFKDACMRFGSAMGTVLTVWCICRWMDHRTLADIGLTLDSKFWFEAFVGLLVGATVVGFIFATQVAAGWIKIINFFEVFDSSENFGLCILWDVIFHINVAIMEELPVRGWMLYNLTEAIRNSFGFSFFVAFSMAMLCQSSFFVLLHLPSPGGSDFASMLNIFIGGTVAGINVLVMQGRLGLVMGWHFAWNITMGNVFGLSTSGIPISATFISVAPHPEKKDRHGGVFGPEGGFVAPFAYLLTVVLVVLLFGLPTFSSATPGSYYASMVTAPTTLASGATALSSAAAAAAAASGSAEL